MRSLENVNTTKLAMMPFAAAQSNARRIRRWLLLQKGDAGFNLVREQIFFIKFSRMRKPVDVIHKLK